MTITLKPILLLADSHVLFTADHCRPVAAAISDAVSSSECSAAYIGASNGDDPAFFSIFESAMDRVGARDRRMIRADFGADDVRFLASADIILLAGGDPLRGWNALERGGTVQLLRERYCAGAVFVGVSAGAALLGEKVAMAADATAKTFDALRLVPWIVDAHDEKNDWQRLRRAVDESGIGGLGLPTGRGLIVHADTTLEPVRRPSVQFDPRGSELPRLLMPDQ